MKIIIRDPAPDEEDSVVISVKHMTENILNAINMIKHPEGGQAKHLTVYQDNDIFKLPASDIFYVESVDLKTFVYVEKSVYQSKLKLYEIKEMLSDKNFLQISRQAIVNIKKIRSISPIGNGRFQATLINDEKIIISRQNVAVLKEVFGI